MLHCFIIGMPREVFNQVRAILLSDLPLVTVSALTLGMAKTATDQQLEEEKKKTEAERQKNGKISSEGERYQGLGGF